MAERFGEGRVDIVGEGQELGGMCGNDPVGAGGTGYSRLTVWKEVPSGTPAGWPMAASKALLALR